MCEVPFAVEGGKKEVCVEFWGGGNFFGKRLYEQLMGRVAQSV